MKRQISFFKLTVRTSIWKILVVLCAMTISQVLLFFVMGAGEEAYLLDALERVPSAVVVWGSLWLLTAILCIPMSDRGGRMNNLVLRLGLSEKRIFWIQVVYNVVAYSLFVMVQGLTMVLLSLIYDWVTPGTLDPMAVFVTSYQHPLFHRFFPLHNLMGVINALLMVAGLSICTAAFPTRQRHRMNSFSTFLMAVYAALYFCALPGADHLGYSEMVIHFMVIVILIPISLYGVMSLEVDDDGKT